MFNFVTKSLFRVPRYNILNEDNSLFLQVKKKLKFIQHRETMMKLEGKNVRQLTNEELKKDYLVQSFFSHFEKDMKVFESANKVTGNQKISYPRNCWYQVQIPFEKEQKIRLMFRQFYQSSPRIGRLLEIMDYISVQVCYKYIYQQLGDIDTKATIVTACVDNMNFFKHLVNKRDLTITAYPTFAGRSSIEVQLDLWQADKDKQEQELKATALFLMVARDSHDRKKAYVVPQFSDEGELEKDKACMRYQLGLKNQERRKNEAKSSLEKQPPLTEEIATIHNFFTQKNFFMNDKQNWSPIEESKLEKNLLMHFQDRNLHGHIFGGNIMREAFEIGWLAAHLHAKGDYIQIYHIDDFQFINPVPVGSIVNIEARVTYCKGNLIHVVVNVATTDINRIKTKTNDMHITFVTKNIPIVKQVFPITYEEAMQFVLSRRRVNNLLN